MRKLEHLFNPISIGTMEVKNRIVMAPMATNLASPDGEVSEALIIYHTVRAQGGVGLITTGDTIISESAKYIRQGLGLFDDRFIPGWHKLTEAVHSYGAKIAPQLIHPAFNARSSISGVQPVAASPIASSRRVKELPRELTIKEIKEIVEQFGNAAWRAKEAGCDAVQLHCAHCHHLLGGFLSPLHNKRTDAYGGSTEERLRITLEVIQNIRSKVGWEYPVLVRISGAEFEPGGLTIEETQYVAKLLEKASVNAIHVSGGITAKPWLVEPPMGVPPASNASLAEVIKKVIDIPVILVGGITTPRIAESVLATGKADMVAMARALLADPQFPNKAAVGNWEDIRPCVRDMSCLTRLGMGKISCMINPAVGTEEEMKLAPTPSPRKILVVGGGPGGMEAARVAALRGHQVTLMEKVAKLGGQLLMAAFPPTKQEFTLVVKYLATQLEKAGVNVKLNCAVTPEMVEEFKPDAVVIATGGLPHVPSDLPKPGRGKVVTAWDVLSGSTQVSGEVLVIGGGQVGCETADFIAHPVNDMTPGADRVTIMECLDNVVLDERGPQRSLLVQRLLEKGVRIITGAECVEVMEDGARYRRDDKEETIRGFDAVVLAMGTVPYDPLSEKLKDSPFSLHVIGDAKQPRKASDAIAEGWEVGRSI